MNVEITIFANADEFCPANREKPHTRNNDETVYLAGCAAGTGTVVLRDASNDSVIRTYNFTIDAAPPATPTPTPTPVVPSLSPDPSSVNFEADGTVWHRFTVNSDRELKVVANPTGSDIRVEINESRTRSFCPAEQNDDDNSTFGNGDSGLPCRVCFEGR